MHSDQELHTISTKSRLHLYKIDLVIAKWFQLILWSFRFGHGYCDAACPRFVRSLVRPRKGNFEWKFWILQTDNAENAKNVHQKWECFFMYDRTNCMGYRVNAEKERLKMSISKWVCVRVVESCCDPLFPTLWKFCSHVAQDILVY